MKPAVVAPAAILAEAGTLSAELFEESATTKPPLGAAGEMVTVQMELAPATTLEGEHCKLDSGGNGAKTVIAPPFPETDIAFPLGSAPTGFVKAIGTVEPPDAAAGIT